MGILAEWLSSTSSIRKLLQYHIATYVLLVLLSSNYIFFFCKMTILRIHDQDLKKTLIMLNKKCEGTG